MGRYYNKTRSPVSTTLRDGTTGYFPPKKWITLSPEKEGVAALVQWVKKGILVRRPDKAEPISVPIPAPVAEPRVTPPTPPAAKPVPEPVQEPKIDVHVDTPIVPEVTSTDADRTSLSGEVSENTVALEVEADTESKVTKRSKSRRRG